jgi:ABC-2 type transport system ATP-binding protein
VADDPRHTSGAGEPAVAAVAAIEVESLEKHYGDTAAVSDLSFRVEAGEIVGLIGPDGAGKTTTMRILCGLLHPDSGSTRVLGFDSARETRGVKEHVGYMPQRFSLYPDLTVAENMRFFADLFGVAGDERKRLEDQLMEFSRLAPYRSRRAAQLSGGMKQKLALSCTLIHTPRVLILDEPTTGVDPVSRREFWRILRDLAGDGLALLVSTPYMDEATICDRVLLMHRGRAIAAGTPGEVTGTFPRRIVEVRGPDIRAARRRLLEEGGLDISVNRFGDALHVVHDPALSPDVIAARVNDLDVTARPVEPTIEDTFVEFMGDTAEVTT